MSSLGEDIRRLVESNRQMREKKQMEAAEWNVQNPPTHEISITGDDGIRTGVCGLWLATDGAITIMDRLVEKSYNPHSPHGLIVLGADVVRAIIKCAANHRQETTP